MVDRILRVWRDPVRWVPWLLASLPALWIVWFVLQGSHLQYADYWDMMPRTVNSSGGLDLAGMLTFQSEHPVVIPQFLYWLNVHVTGGSNIWLGLLVVAVVVAQVILLHFFVEPEDRRRWAAATVVVVGSALLFSRQGVHNFSKSMSGTAWLTANLFVVAAILSRYRDRVWLAGGFGVAASISYATGLVVWPVLIVVGMIRDRRWLPDWRVIVVGVFPVGFYLVQRPESDPLFRPGPRETVETALAMGGSLFSGTLGVMQVVTTLGVATGIGLVGYALWKRAAGAAPWIGLFGYSACCLLLISWGRIVLIGSSFPSRYASLSALLWISLFGLAGTVLRWRWYALAPAALLVVASVTYATPAVDEQRLLWRKQDDLAAALRLDLADDNSYSYAFRDPLDVSPLLESLGHYPFNGMFDADCGLLDTTYDPATIEQASSGDVTIVRRTTGGAGARIIAELPDETPSAIDCVVIGDADDRVVGIGTLGIGRQKSLVGMSTGSEDDGALAAVAPYGTDYYRVLLVLDDGSLLQIGDNIKKGRVKDL